MTKKDKVQVIVLKTTKLANFSISAHYIKKVVFSNPIKPTVSDSIQHTNF